MEKEGKKGRKESKKGKKQGRKEEGRKGEGRKQGDLLSSEICTHLLVSQSSVPLTHLWPASMQKILSVNCENLIE